MAISLLCWSLCRFLPSLDLSDYWTAGIAWSNRELDQCHRRQHCVCRPEEELCAGRKTKELQTQELHKGS